MSRRRSIPVVFAVATYLVVEGASLSGLFLLRRFADIEYAPTATALSPEARKNLDAFLARGEGASMAMDPELGWAPIRGAGEINSAGMRADREYAAKAPPGVLRIAAFGDSFTYGSDVALGADWATQITTLAPAIEVLNYGVPAYGLDQAYLRYRAVGSDYRPDIVLIGYMSEKPRASRQRVPGLLFTLVSRRHLHETAFQAGRRLARARPQPPRHARRVPHPARS